MTLERRKRFVSVVIVLLAIFDLNKANNATNETDSNEELIFPQLIEDEIFGQYHEMIEYVTDLFCMDNISYRFNHIYAERSLSTALADILISRINKCMTAGILVSRYDSSTTETFKIDYPRTLSNTVIGIHVYNLNIVQNLGTLNLNWIDKQLPRSKDTKYIFLLEEELETADDTELLKKFTEIWEKQVLNAIIVYWNETLRAVTFIPFPENKDISMELDFIQGKDLYNHSRLFFDKARNLYGRPFKVVSFYDESRARFNQSNTNDLSALDGTDGLLTQLIVKKMNATLVLDKPSDGGEIGEYFEDNKTANGCLRELMSGYYDFGMNVRFYRLNHFEGKVEATHAVGRDDICFLVPRKGRAEDLSNIFRPFLGETWLTIALTLPCYVLIFYMLINGFKGVRSYQYFIFQFYAHMIQQSSSYEPQKHRQRILFIFWIWFMFLLSSMYQGKMSGSLIAPKELENIQNIEELTRSNLKVLSLTRYNKQIIEFFDDARYQGAYKPLFKRLENGTNPELKAKIQKFDNSYAFANKYHINVHWRRNFTKNSDIYFHQVKQCAIPYLAVHGIKYGTPLKGRINFIIRQAQESGIIEKWERINTVGDQKTQAKVGGDDANVAFSVANLQTVFYMYFIGIGISIFAFLIEKFSKNNTFLKMKNRTRKCL